MIVDCLAHVHSSVSYDSPTDLAEIAAVARREGIQCVLMSEHNNTLDDATVAAFVERCEALTTPECLLIPGLELSLDDNRVHLLAYGVRQFIPSLSERSLPPLIRRIHELGGVAVLAHPAHKDAYKRIPAEDLDDLDGMEIWNVRNGSRFYPHLDEAAALRAARRRGVSLAAFAGLDWHFISHFERLVLRTDVTSLDAASVLSAIRAGRFTITGRLTSLGSMNELTISQRGAAAISTRGIIPMRKTIRRWQARLEQRGVVAPQALIRLARRFF